MAGLGGEAAPAPDYATVDLTSSVARAAAPALRRAMAELDGAPVGLVLADHSARVVAAHFPDRSLAGVLQGLGVVPGMRLAEATVGTNAIGTPVETRHGMVVRGVEHFMPAFHGFTCYGHPIVNPVSGRLAGALTIGGYAENEHPMVATLVRRIVGDIEEQLQQDAGQANRRLLAAFQNAARGRARPVMVVGHGVVLATQAALDVLEPADHAMVRAYAEEAAPGRAMCQGLVLASGRVVEVTCTTIEGVAGVLVEIDPQREDPRAGIAPRDTGWPMLIVGELGSGRSTEARRVAGPGATIVDVKEIVVHGEQVWATSVSSLLEQDGPCVVVENVQLLGEAVTMFLSGCLRTTQRNLILTSTPGEHLDGVHAPLTVRCLERRDLIPLRRRRHEIPHLAQRMLADADLGGRRRLSAETLRVLAGQPWPGNLSELRRVIDIVVAVRSAGDIVPADLPASHRGVAEPSSPFRQAEREVIVAAIDAAGGNKVEAARALGVSRSTLYNRMKALRIY